MIIKDLILKIKGNYRSYREGVVGAYFEKSEIMKAGKIIKSGNVW